MPLISRVVLVPEDRIEATERFWGGESELVDGVADFAREYGPCRVVFLEALVGRGVR